MPRVLLTGMSGTGKSTVLALLMARGYECLDADDGHVEVQPDGGQLWRIDAISAWLDARSHEVAPLFVAGCEPNMVDLLPGFDRVVLLTAPWALIERRIANRTTNDFGKSPDELCRIRTDVEHTEPLLRRIADHVVASTGTPQETADAVLRCVQGTFSSRPASARTTATAATSTRSPTPAVPRCGFRTVPWS